jgi:hypothetical protein
MRDLLPRSQILVGFSEAAKRNGSPDPATRRDSPRLATKIADLGEFQRGGEKQRAVSVAKPDAGQH